MAAKAGLCLALSETPEDTFCRVVVHLFSKTCPRQHNSEEMVHAIESIIYTCIETNISALSRKYLIRP